MTSKMMVPAMLLLVAGACADAPVPTAVTSAPVQPVRTTQAVERYVAIGTSISMGWASNGVFEGTQKSAWPAQLAAKTATPFRSPLIAAPGCTSPLIAPLGAFRRLSGESAAPSTVCAPNVPGVTLPTQNMGIAGAITAHALLSRPEVVGASIPWYTRVLPTGHTQVSAALAQAPTTISVELGGNEVLNGSSGLVLDGVTIVPFPSFAGPYQAIMNAVQSSGAKVLLVGLPLDARALPFLRPGDEIWQEREAFAAFNVRVDENCAGSPNWINAANKSMNVIAAAAMSPTPVTYSCADVGGIDYVLTPADVAFLNSRLAAMDGFIRNEATTRGFAYMSLGAVFDLQHIRRYSIVRHLTSAEPFGPYVSLDGVHPSVIGHAVLARAASQAIADRYPGTFLSVAALEAPVTLRANEDIASPMSLAMARTAVARLRGQRLPVCPMPGECVLDMTRR